MRMLGKVRLLFKKIHTDKKILFTSLASFLFVVSFSLCFISGSINPALKTEETAEYVADVAKNHTKNGMYAALLVEPNENTEKKLIDTGTELYSLYGVFRENIASFASTVNADHGYDVRFKDIETSNLSYVYVTSGFNTVAYHGHYKHEYYPLELMFMREKDPQVWGQSNFNSLLYISQTQADKFLDLKGMEHNEENYKGLLKTRIFLTTNGIEKEWQIEDIYLEQNYFYDAVNECAGEFVFAWSSDAFLQGPKKQSMYFLSPYAFRNSFYFDYATTLYPQSDFVYKINEYNFIDNFKIDDSRLIFSNDSKDSIGSSLLLVLGILLVLSGFAVIYLFIPDLKWWHHLLFGSSVIVPYLIFKIVFLISGNPLLFSTFSTKVNLIMLFCSILVYVIILFIKKRKTYVGG